MNFTAYFYFSYSMNAAGNGKLETIYLYFWNLNIHSNSKSLIIHIFWSFISYMTVRIKPLTLDFTEKMFLD